MEIPKEPGRIHLVTKWVAYVDEADGRPRWGPSGFERVRGEDGRAVQALPDAGYEVAASGIVLQRIAPAIAPGVPLETGPEHAFTSEGGRVVGTRTSENGSPAGAAESARLMSEFGLTRSGRFFR